MLLPFLLYGEVEEVVVCIQCLPLMALHLSDQTRNAMISTDVKLLKLKPVIFVWYWTQAVGGFEKFWGGMRGQLGD